jgi:TonB family protein
VATGEAALRGVKTGGGSGGRVASIGNLRGSGGIAEGTTGSVGPERRVSGIVKTEAPAVDGQLDPGIIAKEVRARMGAIRACYERSLKRNPGLGGKIVLHWTITAAGTVTGVDTSSDSMGDSEVVDCIKKLVLRWRFPAPQGGPAEVEFPFVFQASN